MQFQVQPSDVAANAVITPAVVVSAHNYPPPHNTVVVRLLNAPGATLSGTLTKPVVGGVATFDDLSIDVPGTGYVLQAGQVFDGVKSTPFNVT